jgi:ATP-dependent helicase HrpA
VEEFRVSLFAQELGTAEPVSAVKLDRWLAAGGGTVGIEAKPEPKPVTTAPIATVKLPEKRTEPLKNFGALDKLFKK